MMKLLNEQMVGPGVKLNVDDLAMLFSTPSQEPGEGQTSENPPYKVLPDRSEVRIHKNTSVTVQVSMLLCKCDDDNDDESFCGVECVMGI